MIVLKRFFFYSAKENAWVELFNNDLIEGLSPSFWFLNNNFSKPFVNVTYKNEHYLVHISNLQANI